MKRRILALLLCGMMLIAGCGNTKTEETESDAEQTEPATESTMTQDEFHGVSYQIPKSWTKSTETDVDAIYYIPEGENEHDIVIMLLYTDFKDKNVYSVYTVRQIYEKMVEGLTNTTGITELTEDYRELNGYPVGIAKYLQTSEEEVFGATQHFFAMPEQEGLFTCGYVVSKGVEDVYEDDYQALLDSLQFPSAAPSME